MTTGEKGAGEAVSREESRAMVDVLSKSAIYADYERAFNAATGLPLRLRPLESFEMAHRQRTNENPFCALMADSNRSCAACLQMQHEMEEQCRMEPRTLKCFAGMCDTSVPIRVGNRLVAFLQTGQVLLHEPDGNEFSGVAQQLIEWGTKVDLKRAEEAFFQTRVLDKAQYEAFIHLLATFSEHLASISNNIMVRKQQAEPNIVARAREFIKENYDQHITLAEAANAVNTSAYYFCKMFKKSTGLTFTEYLTRLRVEKAKSMLMNPNLRVSEIAFEVGFDSLSQFNRSFKRITGQNPTQYRKEL